MNDTFLITCICHETGNESRLQLTNPRRGNQCSRVDNLNNSCQAHVGVHSTFSFTVDEAEMHIRCECIWVNSQQYYNLSAEWAGTSNESSSTRFDQSTTLNCGLVSVTASVANN